MADIKTLRVTANLLNKDFQTEINEQALKTAPDEAYEQLKSWLAEKIAYLLANHFEYLLHIMYRIDVNEADFKAALNAGDSNEIPFKLADLVIQREITKAQWREWMKQ